MSLLGEKTLVVFYSQNLAVILQHLSVNYCNWPVRDLAV